MLKLSARSQLPAPPFAEYQDLCPASTNSRFQETVKSTAVPIEWRIAAKEDVANHPAAPHVALLILESEKVKTRSAHACKYVLYVFSGLHYVCLEPKGRSSPPALAAPRSTASPPHGIRRHKRSPFVSGPFLSSLRLATLFRLPTCKVLPLPF